MSYLDRNTYEKLYARYVGDNARPISDLMQHAGDLTGKCVLDLCGGAGAIAVAAKKKGAAKVVLMDGDTNMSDSKMLNRNGIECYYTSVNSYLYNVPIFTPYDVVFCRQAVNYWLTEQNAEMIARKMNPGGLFIFNTFANEPSHIPTVKEYKLDGHSFVEISWRCGSTVHHVQCRDGLPPHTTKFEYISPDEFISWLHPHFHIDVFTREKSVVYSCKKKLSKEDVQKQLF